MKKLLAIFLISSFAFVACEKSDEETVYNPSVDGLVGEWYSSGTNVSTLLVTYFAIDSVYANFESNNTYVVESYAEGAKTTYSGTYTQTKSGTGNIWDILLNQSTPTAVTSEGIFEITKSGSNFSMKYEVAQTEPNIGATAPTADAGFGSTSGGTLQDWNVQTFLKIQN